MSYSDTQQQPSFTIPLTNLHRTHLHEAYPNIQDQLCNKHSQHIIKIKHKFQHIYDTFQPTSYVIAKGMCSISNTKQQYKNNQNGNRQGLMFAIQNGVIIAYNVRQPKSNIYINCNKWQIQTNTTQQLPSSISSNSSQIMQQLILNYKGQLIQIPNISPQTNILSVQLAQLYKIAIQDISLNKIKGSIIYIDNCIQNDCFMEKQALYWAFIVTILYNNEIIKQYSTADILDKLAKYYNKTNKSLNNLYNYYNIFKLQHNIIHIQNNNNHTLSLFPQQKNKKLLFCKLPHLNTFTKNKNNKLITKIKQYQAHILQDIKKQIISFAQFLGKIKQFYVQYIAKSIQSQQNKIEYGSQQYKIRQFIAKYLGYVQGFCFATQQQYIILYVSSGNSINLLKKLNQQLANQLYNHNNHHNSKDILETELTRSHRKSRKWNKYNKKQQYIFSSYASMGFCVLEPKQEIWYMQ